MNYLRQLLDAGVSEEDLPNVLAALQDQGVSQPSPGMPQPRYDIAPVPQNSMRVENGPDAGKVTSLDFTSMNPAWGGGGSPAAPAAGGGMSWGDVNPAWGQQQAPRQLKVFGSGNGSTVQLTPEAMTGPIALDRTRAAVDVPGVGRAVYGKDGNAYVLGPDGQPQTKVILGYDDAGTQARNKYMQDRRKTEADIAQSQASTLHSQEQIRASQVNNPDLTAEGGSINSGLTGDDFLKQLSPMVANEVKAIANGEVPFNPRSQRQMNLLGLVQQVNPNWSASDYNTKNATRLDFSPKGKSGEAIQRINQALHHGEVYLDAVNKLDNFNTLPGILNPPVNLAQQKLLGDTRQGDVETAANALSEELKKIYAGGGGGSLAELQNWQKTFDPNAGRDQQRSYLKRGMELLRGAIDSRKEAYERGMGPTADFNKFISPSALQTLDRLSGNASGGGAALPMPTNKAQLQVGATYQTARGPAVWNGSAFEAH